MWDLQIIVGEIVCPKLTTTNVIWDETDIALDDMPSRASDDLIACPVPQPSITLAAPDTPPILALHTCAELDDRMFVPLDDTQAGMGPPALLPGSTAGASPPTGAAATGYLRPPSIDLPVVSLDTMQSVDPFQHLIDILDAALRAGQSTLPRSYVSIQLKKRDERVYQAVGVTKFREYAALAKQQGIIELGGSEGHAWISLLPTWHGRGRRLPSPS